MPPRLKPAVLTLLALCMPAVPALAHAHLKAAAPPIDGTAAGKPDHVDLTFSETINPKFSGISLTAPDGSTVSTGEAQLAPGNESTLRVMLPAVLKAGRYRVEWHALARDGHKTTGSYGFTIVP